MLMAIGCSVHLFNRLKKGERFFGCVPREVGDIVYCDTSNPSKEPEENYVRTRFEQKIMIGVVSIVLPLLALMFYPLHRKAPISYEIVVAILLLVWGFCVIMRFLPVKFKGTDYFVGTRGIARRNFEGERGRIVKKDILLYADVAAFSVKGKFVRGSDGDDSGVVFTTKIQLKEGVGEKSKLKYHSFDSTVSEDLPYDKLTDIECRFWKRAEQEWQAFVGKQ